MIARIYSLQEWLEQRFKVAGCPRPNVYKLELQPNRIEDFSLPLSPDMNWQSLAEAIRSYYAFYGSSFYGSSWNRSDESSCMHWFDAKNGIDVVNDSLTDFSVDISRFFYPLMHREQAAS